MHILIIEDEPSIADSLRYELSSESLRFVAVGLAVLLAEGTLVPNQRCDRDFYWDFFLWLLFGVGITLFHRPHPLALGLAAHGKPHRWPLRVWIRLLAHGQLAPEKEPRRPPLVSRWRRCCALLWICDLQVHVWGAVRYHVFLRGMACTRFLVIGGFISSLVFSPFHNKNIRIIETQSANF